MNKLFTKIAGLTLGLAMAIGVGVAAANNSGKAVQTLGEETTVASFSRSGNTNTVTGGTFSFAASGQSGYYQDGNGDLRYLQIKSSTAYWTTTPLSITVNAKIGGGTGNTDLTNAVQAVLLDKNGEAISITDITKHITTNTGNNYSISVTPVNNVYGIKIQHQKQSGYNVRYYSFSLSYEADEGAPTVTGVTVNGDMTNKSYTSVDTWDKTGLTAEVTMSDASAYTGDIDWSFEPATPGEMIKTNGDKVTSGTVVAKATASSVTGSKNVTGISVDYATVAQLTAATPATGNLEKVVAKGIISEIEEVSVANGNATYYISDDGTTTGQYYIYRGKGVNNVSFTNANDIKVGDEVIVYGNVTTYSGTKEFKSGNYLLKLDRPTPTEPTITITESNFSMNVGDADVAVHATVENLPEGGSVVWESSLTSVATMVVDGEDNKVHAVGAGETTITAKILNSSSEEVASNSITVTVTEPAIVNGDTFIIKSTYDSKDYYLTGVANNLGTVSATKADAVILTAIESTTAGQFQFKFGNNYLSYSGSSTGLYTTTDSKQNSTLWTVINSGTTVVIESVATEGRTLQFNYNSGNARFACYSSTLTAVAIEKVVAPEVDEVIVLGDATADAEGALSISKDFLYEVTYVDPSNPGTGKVSVSVLNSSEETTGATVTAGPSDGSFTVTFTASDTYTVKVTSQENVDKFASATIEVTNVYVPVMTSYTLYEGTTVGAEKVLTEGDYVVYYNGVVMNNTIDSDRAQYEATTPVDDTISTEETNIVWHIAPKGDYYTIYSGELNKYLASTGGKNKIQLLDDATDEKVLWSVTISNDGKFEFVNKVNDGKDINATLRYNSGYGFACYGTSTGDTLSLYKKAYNAVDFANILINYLGGVCDATTGNTNVDNLKATWAILNAEYALLADDVKAALVDSSESAKVLSALSAYDYVVGKYNVAQGVTEINDFLNREPDPVGSARLSSIDGDNITATIVVIVSMATITLLGACLILRKRREQR